MIVSKCSFTCIFNDMYNKWEIFFIQMHNEISVVVIKVFKKEFWKMKHEVEKKYRSLKKKMGNAS